MKFLLVKTIDYFLKLFWCFKLEVLVNSAALEFFCGTVPKYSKRILLKVCTVEYYVFKIMLISKVYSYHLNNVIFILKHKK